ncbi:MAG: LapA family protein [Pseudomonadota bacterium]
MIVFRLLKLAILVALCAVLTVIGVANMAPVDLALVPDGIVEGMPKLSGVPLTVVILAAMLLGFVIGELLEWLREHKHRREVAVRGREIDTLKAENARLKSKISDPKEDLPRIAAQ